MPQRGTRCGRSLALALCMAATGCGRPAVPPVNAICATSTRANLSGYGTITAVVAQNRAPLLNGYDLGSVWLCNDSASCLPVASAGESRLGVGWLEDGSLLVLTMASSVVDYGTPHFTNFEWPTIVFRRIPPDLDSAVKSYPEAVGLAAECRMMLDFSPRRYRSTEGRRELKLPS